MRVTRWIGGRLLSDTTISRLAVDRAVARDGFTVDVPRGVEVVDHDDGFRRGRLADVRRVAGYAALVPRVVPRGFRLAEVATLTPSATCVSRCDAGHVPLPTGERMDNPVVGPVVSLAYRRGLEQFVVTARPTGPRPSQWKNPFAPPEVRPRSRRLRLRGGSLAGARAEVVVGAYALPQLWALGDELVLTVSGALSSRELVAVAESAGR